MEKKQTEAFKNFIRYKESDISDVLCPLERCADKLEMIEDYFLFRDERESRELNETLANGLGHIVGDIKDDLRLIIAEMMIEVDKDIAAFKKRRAEEKMEKAKASQANA